MAGAQPVVVAENTRQPRSLALTLLAQTTFGRVTPGALNRYLVLTLRLTVRRRRFPDNGAKDVFASCTGGVEKLSRSRVTRLREWIAGDQIAIFRQTLD